MDKVVMLKYSSTADLEVVNKLFTDLQGILTDTVLLALPYSIDVLFDCPLDQVISARDLLNKVIEQRDNQPIVIETKEEDEQDNA